MAWQTLLFQASFSLTLLSSPSSVKYVSSVEQDMLTADCPVQLLIILHWQHMSCTMGVSCSRCYQSDLHPFCLLCGCSVTSVRQLRALQERMISMWSFTMRDPLCRPFSLTICSASSFYSCFQVEDLHSAVSVQHAISLFEMFPPAWRGFHWACLELGWSLCWLFRHYCD